MAITGVLRSGLMQLRVLNLTKALEHYRDRIGLRAVCSTPDGRVCLKGYDEFDHHSIVLRQASTAGMDFMGFKVQDDAYLEKLAYETRRFGLPLCWIEAHTDQPGFGRRLAVRIPTGHRIDFYAEVAMSEPHPGIKNPDIWTEEPKGMGVSGFDHALLYGPNAAQAHRYFTDVLGMGVVEVVEKPDGTNLVAWLSGNNRGHDVAILDYDQPDKLHHVGFKLQDWSEVGRAADIISIYDISLDAGPMRHGITRGLTIYFFDPSGNRNEVYAGGYPYFPDMPTRKWDMEHVGKGIFYYTRELNDRFLSVVT